MTTIEPMQVRNVYAGRLHDGTRLYLSLEIRQRLGERLTIEHEPITDPVELSISGAIIRKGGSLTRDGDWIAAGQVCEALREVATPADGWTLDDVARLDDIWDRWHLNALRGACAHMPADAHQRWDARERVECAAGTGYTYGTAWLVEPLPADVAEFVADVARRLS